MAFRVTCPECGAVYSMRGSYTDGQNVKCRECEGVFAMSEQTASPYTDSLQTESNPPVNASESQQRSRLIGRTIGGCRIEEKIGQGGMGAVFKALHLGLEIPVAVKILPPSFAKKSQVYVDRFFREARSAAKLQHQNIVTVMNVGHEKGLYFLVMQFIDGNTLQDRLHEERILPEQEAIEILLQILEALEVARQNNIVHRDIKPDNILIDKSGVSKLADLGLAKNTEEDHGITQSGSALGTPHYMAPEQARNFKDADHRADLYSLGCTMFRMLGGVVPFKGNSLYDVLDKHVNQPIPDIKKLNPEISDSAILVLHKLMAKMVEDRYQTASEAIADLRKLQAGVSLTPKVTKTAQKSTRTSSSQRKTKTATRAGTRAATRVEAPVRKSKTPFLIGGAAAVLLAVIATAVMLPEDTQPVVPAVSPTPKPTPVVIAPIDTPAPKPETTPTPAVKPVAIPATVDNDKEIINNLHKQLKAGNPGYNGKGKFQVRDGKVVSAVLSNTGIVNPVALTGLPLESLDLSNNRLANITCIARMPLRSLHLHNTTASGGWPLSQLKLNSLYLHNSLVTDIRLLRLMPLIELTLTPASIKFGLDELRDSTTLKRISINGKDWMTPAQFWTKYPAKVAVKPVTPKPEPAQPTPPPTTPKWDGKVPKTKDELIDALLATNRDYRGTGKIANNRAGEIAQADFTSTGIDNIASFKKLKFTFLRLSGCPVKDLTPLSGMPLNYLYLRRCQGLTYLSPLKGMPLEELDISENPLIKTLSPLSNTTLKSLDLHDCTGITGLDGIKNLKLDKLMLNGCTGLVSIAPLQGMPLRALNISDCNKVNDLRPLAGMPLQQLIFPAWNIKNGIDVVRTIRTLRLIGVKGTSGWSSKAFWRKYDAGEFKAPQ